MSARTPYPRLCRDLTLAPVDDGLLIDGGPRRQRLTGTTADGGLARVLGLLDGTLDTAGVAASAGLTEATTTRLLAVLDRCEILEWLARPAPPGPGLFGHVAAYLARTIGTNREFTVVDEVDETLRWASVLLVGDTPAARAIAADLGECEIGDVRLCSGTAPLTAAGTRWLGGTGRGLAVVADDDGPALPRTVSLLRDRDVPVLRYAAYGDVVEIGPVFCGDWTACVGCLRAGRDPRPGGRDRSAPDLAAALVGGTVLAALSGSVPLARPWRLTRVMLPGWDTEESDVVPAADCPRHGRRAPSALVSPSAAAALAYEWQHEVRPAALTVPKRVTGQRKRRIAAIMTERDPAPPGPARALDGDLSPQAAVLAGLLARTAGCRAPRDGEPATDRWAPSGGNLGSVQLYLATERDIFGLPGTLFRYDDLAHRVLSVHADRVPPARLLGAGAGPLGPDSVLLVFVASVRRIAQKYEDFALRLSHLDAGCAALQLVVAASSAGLGVSFLPAWSDDVSALLELDPGGELVTAVAVLGPVPRTGVSHEREASSCP